MVDPRWRNDVVGKRFARDRIFYHSQIARLVQGLRKISCPFDLRRNRELIESLRQIDPPILLGVKEEQLLLFAIEHPWNIDGTTRIKPKRGKPVDRLRNAVAIVKKIGGIQLLVPLVVINISMEVLRSRL